MQPATPDLARRWLAALLLVPREEREDVVASVESRINALYPMRPGELELVRGPAQHHGSLEQCAATSLQSKPTPQAVHGDVPPSSTVAVIH
jgi:hypothetical protein